MQCAFFVVRLQCTCVQTFSLQIQDEHLLDEPVHMETTKSAVPPQEVVSPTHETQQSHFLMTQPAGHDPAGDTASVMAGWTRLVPKTGTQLVPTTATQPILQGGLHRSPRGRLCRSPQRGLSPSQRELSQS